jgi:ABC transport system ATP-binding/permease protein
MAYLRDTCSNKAYPLVPGNRFTVGRSPRADLPVRDGTCSRQQFLIEVNQHGECTLHPLSKVCSTVCGGLNVTNPVRLDRDVAISVGNLVFEFSIGPFQADAEVIAANPEDVATIFGKNHELVELPTDMVVRIGANLVLGRDPKQSGLVLPHVQVSRIHASIRWEDGRYYLKDLQSTCGTYVSGKQVHDSTELIDGATIGIGPYLITFRNGELKTHSRQSHHQLIARNLTKHVSEHGKIKTILNDVSLAIHQGEFICILGPAGCGKSTLLKALGAREPIDEGKLFLNGINIANAYDQLKRDLAFVPQHDVLHKSLTVEQSLVYTARLRLPEDMVPTEIESQVEQTIQRVGLSKQRYTRIAKLSGGQIKRLSLATELLSEPNIILLDEVTSGLDTQSDQETMRLFQSISEQGKSVVCVTHNLAHVEKNCNLIIVLAEGGKLAYMGPPGDAMNYFQVTQLGAIYERLQERSSEQWGQLFRAHHTYGQMILARTTITTRNIENIPGSELGRESISLKLRQTCRQLAVLLQRYTQILRADFGTIVGAVGQTLLIAALLVLVFGDVTAAKDATGAANLYSHASSSAVLLFLSVVTCYWFGCNNASKEFVKERLLFQKEYHAGLQPIAYYGSKLLPLAGFSILQALAMFGLVYFSCAIPCSFIQASAIVSVSAVIGVISGLLISALAPTEELATLLVPIVLIPQIVLSAGLKSLTGFSELVAECFVSSYWTYGLIRGSLSANLQTYLTVAPTQNPAAFFMLFLQAAICVAIANRALSAKVTWGAADPIGTHPKV